MSNKVNNMDQLLSVSSKLSKLESVTIGDSEFFVKKMSVADKEEYESSVQRRKSKGEIVDTTGMRFDFMRKCLCNEDGALILKDADRTTFSQMDGGFIEDLFTAAAKVNGYRQEDIEKNAL
jgi:hypothetical protein